MNALTTAQEFGPSLLIAALAAPLVILALFLSPRLRFAALAVAPLAPLPALAVVILAIGGGPFAFELPGLRMSFGLDQPGAMLLAAAALVWIAASVFARADITGKPNADRFAVSWLLTMTGSLGVFIAADLLTFYLVYALVSVPAYYLIADDEGAGSIRAGGVYMAFTLTGEAVLLIAFVILAAGEPSGSLDIRAVVAALPASPWRDAALALLIVGFGTKIALAPLNRWMPLAYTAAPIPAAAALSGAAVKAGVIGLIRFLPLGAALSGWGEALAWAGFVSAFYGVAIGLTQKDPKTVLAYSGISQMGVIAAVIGLGLAGADRGAASDAAFYAANHVLAKAALFLTVGVVAALSGRRLSLALIVAAALALSLGGLPLTGGALAKLAVKGPLGDGLARAAAAASAVGTTALMLHFLIRLTLSDRERTAASPQRVWSWLALAVASMAVPWLIFPAVGGDAADAFSASSLWESIWPMLVGAPLAAGLWAVRDALPRIPAGDIIVAEEAAFHASAPFGAAVERLD
jgi:formate hydrogenlyase subunit 3/multisubunit Na+/H+ antiporter MnhD subunit